MNCASYAGVSDTGRVRHENQDRWFADPQAGLYLVADGMGGCGAAGGVAARVVVEVLPRLLRPRLERLDNLRDACESVVYAIAELSDRLHREAGKEYGPSGAGATVVLAVVRGRQALIAHLGDSRAYRFHNGEVEQLTRDHSLVQALIESGDIASDEAEHHPRRGQLTRYVGMPGEPLPEARLIELADGDRLLLCSDGLSGALGSEQLIDILGGCPDPSDACRQLVSAANDSGGKDNITAIVVGVGSRFRPTTNHMEDASPETTPDPLRRSPEP